MMYATARSEAQAYDGRRAIQLHRFLYRVGLSAVNTFAWVFIFQLFFETNRSLTLSLTGTATLYALSQAITFIFTPLTGALLRRGTRRLLCYSISVTALSCISLALAFVPYNDTYNHVYQAIAAFIIFQGFARALYWLPYKAGSVHSVGAHPKASISRESMLALIPAIFGLLVATSIAWIPVVLMGMAILMLASCIPVMLMPEYHERYSWSYSQTVQQLFSFSRRHRVSKAITDGMQAAGLLFVWPLAVFLLFDWSYATLGLVLSISLLLALMLRQSVQALFYALNVHNSPHVLAAYAFSTWVLRLGAGTPVGVISVESLYLSGSRPHSFHIDPVGKDQTADHGHFVDEETALKEMGLAIGRIAMALTLAVLVYFFSDAIAFVVTIVLAGIAAGASVYLASMNPSLAP